MFSTIRKQATITNLLLTLAIVFAMSSGALAATKYLITSTKQIKPSVLASLKGAKGANGTPGTQGPAGLVGTPGTKGENGKQGPEGKEGKEGPAGPKGATGPTGTKGAAGATGATGQTGFTETLPSGKTETGTWSIVVGGLIMTGISQNFAISFPIPLKVEGAIEAVTAAVRFTVKQTANKEFGSSGCKGFVNETPTAPPGTLCVYTIHSNDVKAFAAENIVSATPEEEVGYGPAGAYLIDGSENGVSAAEPGFIDEHGEWAVTAR